MIKKISSSQSGNIFFALFGAVALVGILGSGVMTFMKGPLATSVKITRINTAETQMTIGAQVAVMAAANGPSSGDCDSDGYVEPLEWRDAGALPAPAGGGLIPMSIGISKKDPWGTEYGYCVWDHGSSGVCDDETGAGDNPAERLVGDNDSGTYAAVAIISAGADKVFTTTCRNFSVADVNTDGDLEDAGDLPLVSKAAETDDDIIFTYTYEEATGASGGLWSIKSGDPTTAVINKKVESSGLGSFAGGVLLPDSALITCDATTAGVMARNASGTGIDICDGSSWTAISGGSGVGGSGLILTPNVSTGMDVDGTCGNATCYSTNVVFTLTNNLTPAAASDVLVVSLTNPANFEFVSDNCNGNSIAAGATCQIVVRAKASGNISYAATLNVTGNNSPLALLDGTASNFPGCNAGGNAPGGYYVACGIGGYDLVITPGGCTGGMTNPTCAGGTDSLTATVYSNSPEDTIPNMSADGQKNSVDLAAYSNSAHVFSAANWCNGLVYQGFDDWFLPSIDELQNYFYPNRSSVGGFISSGYYASSTGWYNGVFRYTFRGLRNTGVLQEMTSYYGSTMGYIRCMRWTPTKTVSVTPDTTPAMVSFTPQTVITPAQTITSNAGTIYGVTQPINISISGGTNAKFSKNGGAFTTTATTATNGDTITLQADSPAAGVEQVVTLNAGSSNFTWKLRTAGNNTIRIFTTNSTYNGNIGSVGTADSNCTMRANAAGLPGNWVAVIAASAGEKIINRLPWNWQSLRNMNGQVVATGISDFVDGSVSAAMNYNENGSVTASSLVWTGLTSSGVSEGSSSYTNCNAWTNNNSARSGYVGDSSSTNSGVYFNSAPSQACNLSLRLLCMETNDAGVDTDPDAVFLQPQVVFSSGATGTSNTITIQGVTDEVSVDIAPSAGTANIIKGGVSVGGTSTMAGLNETLTFTLTAPTVLGTKNTATITIGSDSYTWWVGYADSAREAIGFVTSVGYRGDTLGSMANADSICASHASSSSYGLSSQWKALLSDSTGDAINRVSWNWKTLKSPAGAIIVDNGVPDLFDGTLDGAFIADELGGSAAGQRIWTGSTIYGAYDTDNSHTSCDNWTDPWKYGACGVANNLTSSWINIGNCRTTSCQYSIYRFYCIEDVDNITTDTTPNDLDIPYAVQIATSTVIDSDPVAIGGMSTGVTATLSVSATGGSPNFDVNRGGSTIATNQTSYSVQNGDIITFRMTSPAVGNSSNKMTITAGSMTSYWRVWTGDTTGTAVKRVFIENSTHNANMGGVAGADARCQSAATTAGLGGSWKAILSETSENNWAVNRIGYNWSELQLVNGTTVVYAPNLWNTATQSLLNPINRNESGTLLTTRQAWSGTKDNGKAINSDSNSMHHCKNWSISDGSNQNSQKAGYTGGSGINWIYGDINNYSCMAYTTVSLFCIEQ